jgi:hypothetical protein
MDYEYNEINLDTHKTELLMLAILVHDHLFSMLVLGAA